MSGALEITITVPALQGLTEWFEHAETFLNQFVAPALYQRANLIMTEAKRLTPVDTGALRASGHVDEPSVKGAEISVALGFNTPYAIPVHENLTARHPVGQAKYLEEPMLAASKTIGADVKSAIEKSLGRPV